jgi:hypothetical protein
MTQTVSIRYVLRKDFHDAKAPHRDVKGPIQKRRPMKAAEEPMKGKHSLAGDLLS